MWKQNEAGQWKYGTDTTSADFGRAIVEKSLFKPAENDGNAVVYVPAQTLDDAYHEHRLFKYINGAPHKSGFWVEGWFDRDQAIRDYFPNRALVDLATSPGDVRLLTPTTRAPKDYAPTQAVGRDYAVDGTPVPVGGRVLVKDQWFETLSAYPLSATQDANFRPRRVRILDINSTRLEFLSEDNAVEFYDTSGAVVYRDRITNLSRVSGRYELRRVNTANSLQVLILDAAPLGAFVAGNLLYWYNDAGAGFPAATPISGVAKDAEGRYVLDLATGMPPGARYCNTSTNTVPFVVFDTLNDLPDLPSLRCADPVDGDWVRTERYETAGVYRYNGSALVEEADLGTPEKCFHYTAWSVGGEANTNGQFFLERLGAREIDQDLFETRLPTLQNGYGKYPLPGQRRVFSKGSAHLVKHELGYDIAKLTPASGSLQVEPRVRFMLLDRAISSKVGYRATYPDVSFPAASFMDPGTSVLELSARGNAALSVDGASRFSVAPSLFFSCVADATEYAVEKPGRNLLVGTNRLVVPASMLVAVGDLLQLNSGSTISATVVIAAVTAASGGNVSVTFSPRLSPKMAEQVYAGSGLASARLINYAENAADLADCINRSYIGEHYQLLLSADGHTFSVRVRDNPAFAYASRNMTINPSWSSSVEVKAEDLDNGNYNGGYFPIYAPGFSLTRLLDKAGMAPLGGHTMNTLGTLSLAYNNNELSKGRVGREGRYLIFGSDLHLDPVLSPNSPLAIKPGMKLAISAGGTPATVYAESAVFRTTTRSGTAYTEYVVRTSTGLELFSPGPGVSTAINLGVATNDVLQLLQDASPAAWYDLPQEGYAQAIARDHTFRHVLSGILFTDGERELRTYNYVGESANLYSSPSFELKDGRMKFNPIEAYRLGVEGRVGPGTLLEPGTDWVLLDDLMIITPDAAKSRRIRFVDGLDEDKILNKLEGQGKYAWVLNPGVVAVGAVVGCTGKNGTGDLIWYAGEWRAGTWKEGNWYSGTWRTGVWEQGNWHSYLVTVSPNSVRVNFASQRDSHSIWRGGTWIAGRWHGGEWRRGVWTAGFFNGGLWKTGTWVDGTWNGGVWKAGAWMQGTWNGGDFHSGDWFDGTWNSGATRVSRFGTASLLEFDSSGAYVTGSKRAVWHGGTWNGGEFHSGAGNADHRASVWWNGDWKGGVWHGGTFVLGRWSDGQWLNGVWLGGYPLVTDAGTRALSNPVAFSTASGPASADVDLAGSALKRLTVNTSLYDAVLHLTNSGHHLRAGNVCYFIGRTASSDASAFVANGPTANTYAPKLVTAVPAGLPSAVVVSADYGSIGGHAWETENVLAGRLPGGPFLVPSWHGGDWRGGIWRNGFFNGGTWHGGLWVDGAVQDGVMGHAVSN